MGRRGEGGVVKTYHPQIVKTEVILWKYFCFQSYIENIFLLANDSVLGGGGDRSKVLSQTFFVVNQILIHAICGESIKESAWEDLCMEGGGGGKKKPLMEWGKLQKNVIFGCMKGVLL